MKAAVMRLSTFILIPSSCFLVSLSSIVAIVTSTTIEESEKAMSTETKFSASSIRRRLLKEETNNKVSRSSRPRPTKGSSKFATTSKTAENRNLQAFFFDGFDRKDAPAFSKDALKFDRGDYQEGLIFSDSPSPGPSMTSSPTRQPSETPSSVPSVLPSLRPTSIPSANPTFWPTRQPSIEPSLYPTTTYHPTINDTFIPGQLLLAAFYYPWHADDFHRGDGYLREHLSPPQLPQLGEYDDRESHVLQQHLRWSRQANINLWVGFGVYRW